MASSVDSPFEPSKKTWMSLGGIKDRKYIKSFAAFSFVRPCGLEILSIISDRDSRTVHGGWAIGLTDSTFGRASPRHARRVFPGPVRVILSVRVRKGCPGSSRAVRVVDTNKRCTATLHHLTLCGFTISFAMRPQMYFNAHPGLRYSAG